ncbi:MAG: outer membrane beta-barrel protein [Melioribacteraceae bacterium]|nr:MAG: outer membrane beta-barrel protein [Melioribacteraceae bacterium]
MKKVLFTVLVLLLSASFIYGQTEKGKIAIGIGGEVALPSGDAADASEIGTGFGGTARFEYGFSNNLVGFVDAGYLMWPGDEVTYSFFGSTTTMKWDWSAIVVMGGVKYFFAKGLYGMAQAGIHAFTFDVETTGAGAGFGDASSSESKFGFAFGAGYELPLGSMALDLSAKYTFAASDFNYIGIRAGLKFPLK